MLLFFKCFVILFISVAIIRNIDKDTTPSIPAIKYNIMCIVGWCFFPFKELTMIFKSDESICFLIFIIITVLFCVYCLASVLSIIMFMCAMDNIHNFILTNRYSHKKECLTFKIIKICYKVNKDKFALDNNGNIYYNSDNCNDSHGYILVHLNFIDYMLFITWKYFYDKSLEKNKYHNSVIVQDTLETLEQKKFELDKEIELSKKQIVECTDEFDRILNNYNNK